MSGSVKDYHSVWLIDSCECAGGSVHGMGGAIGGPWPLQ